MKSRQPRRMMKTLVASLLLHALLLLFVGWRASQVRPPKPTSRAIEMDLVMVPPPAPPAPAPVPAKPEPPRVVKRAPTAPAARKPEAAPEQPAVAAVPAPSAPSI